MEYKITIEKVMQPTDTEKYPKSERIYEQTTGQIDLVAIIQAVNMFSPKEYSQYKQLNNK